MSICLFVCLSHSCWRSFDSSLLMYVVYLPVGLVPTLCFVFLRIRGSVSQLLPCLHYRLRPVSTHAPTPPSPNPLWTASRSSTNQLTREYPIANTDRSVGGRLSGSIAGQWGNKGFESAGGDLELRFKGSAGQTFGAFNLPGVSLHLEGEANDYVGKGLNGGQIIIVPNR